MCRPSNEELERAWSEADRLREENVELAGRLAVALDNLRAISRHPPSVVDEEAFENGVAPEELRTVVDAVEPGQSRVPPPRVPR